MNESGTHCANCGTAILGESPDGDKAQRKPCPKCGSLARDYPIKGQIIAHTSISGNATVVTYPQRLLDICKGLIEKELFGISVVVAHMACEVSVERVLSAAFVSKGLQYLEDSVLEFLSGYNLGNDRHRKLYTALTGDHIEQQAFWLDFKDSAELRNKIIHRGHIVGRTEAEKSYKTTSAFVAHLKQ